eukprot:1442554-Pleurochrysis_carterae.AAC.1
MSQLTGSLCTCSHCEGICRRSLGRGGPAEPTSAGLGSGKGSLEIHDVHFCLLQRAYSTRVYMNLNEITFKR